VRRATARLEAAQAALDGARAELYAARTRLAAARVRDQQMQERLAAAEERLAAAEADLVEGRQSLEDQRGVVTDVITSIYQEGDPELLAFASLLDAQDASDLTLRQEMGQVMVGRESRAYDELRAAEVLLEVRQQQVEEARDQVAVQRREAAAHLVTMKELEATAQDARDRVRALVDDRRSARKSAAQARQKDRAQLARLRAQERRIKQLILEQARKARAGRGGYSGGTGGLLSRPVPGGVTSPYGYRIHPIYGYYGLHNGTDFYTPCGQPMQAVASGRVIARYYSPVYGNRLFLGLGMINGKFVTAVYNHASSYSVGVGATVGRGSVLGYAGSTGWSTGCHLHFTILANGQPVPPSNYL
jgi:murein DD-endopeptidase MepM/ murein hydrolase activator NlpD